MSPVLKDHLFLKTTFKDQLYLQTCSIQEIACIEQPLVFKDYL